MQQAALTVWVERGLLRRFAREADLAFPDETGGILLGWRNGGDVVVRDVVDAGPRAERWATGMRPDAAYQAAEVTTAFEASDGAITYLGDWHSHPRTAASVSGRDRKTLRNIASDADAECPEPLMLIVGGGEPGWELGAWVGRLGRLGRWGPLHVRQLEVRPFDDP